MRRFRGLVEYAHLERRGGDASLSVAGLLEVEGEAALGLFRLAVWVALETPVVAADVEQA